LGRCFDVDQAATLGYVLSMHSLSVDAVDKITRHLNVVRCALAKLKDNDDWRRTSNFQTLTKIGGKNCRVIIDSGSCVNAVTSGMVTKLGLKTVPYPQLYKVSWVNSASIDVKDRCLIPILFATYSDKFWRDVVTMDVGHIILGRYWLYDRDVTIYGRPNSCSFVHEGKKIKLASLRPTQPTPETTQTEASSSKKVLTLISPKLIDKEIVKGFTIIALIARKINDDPPGQISLATIPLLKKFADVFLEELPDSLPPMRDIQHAIDLVPRSSLPNLPHYRMNPTEHAELKRQVN